MSKRPQIRNVLSKTGEETTVDQTIYNIEEKQQQANDRLRDQIAELLKLRENDGSFNSIASQIINSANKETFVLVLFQNDCELYKKALLGNQKTADFLTKTLFDLAGIDAIKTISRTVFSDFFIDPNGNFDEDTLKKVASSFLTATHRCGLSFEPESLLEGIRTENRLTYDERKEAASKIYRSFPEEYRPSETAMSQFATQLAAMSLSKDQSR
jgi:hypothetical protein